MSISASQVKELRELTGAGMMDCKAALAETNGDVEAAVDWLRAKGIAKADKKAGRTAAEGLLALLLPATRLLSLKSTPKPTSLLVTTLSRISSARSLRLLFRPTVRLKLLLKQTSTASPLRRLLRTQLRPSVKTSAFVVRQLLKFPRVQLLPTSTTVFRMASASLAFSLQSKPKAMQKLQAHSAVRLQCTSLLSTHSL